MNAIPRSYSDLRRLHTWQERFDYLRIFGEIGVQTFGSSRYLNQMLYQSHQWRQARDIVIIRDKACDLGIQGQEINGNIRIHHMNAVTVEDIENGNPAVFDPEFLVCTSLLTHNAIHYGDAEHTPLQVTERTRNDTCPWKR